MPQRRTGRRITIRYPLRFAFAFGALPSRSHITNGIAFRKGASESLRALGAATLASLVDSTGRGVSAAKTLILFFLQYL